MFSFNILYVLHATKYEFVHFAIGLNIDHLHISLLSKTFTRHQCNIFLGGGEKMRSWDTSSSTPDSVLKRDKSLANHSAGNQTWCANQLT